MKKKYSKDTGKLFRKNKEKDTDKNCFLILWLRIIGQRKAIYRQKTPEKRNSKKETANKDILIKHLGMVTEKSGDLLE